MLERSRLGGERDARGEELVQDDAERVHVGARIRRGAGQHLGRHVAEGSVRPARRGGSRRAAGGGQAEVDQRGQRGARDRPANEDVLRLEIGVDHAVLVQRPGGGEHRVAQRARGRQIGRCRWIDRQLGQLVGERATLDELHRDPRAAVGEESMPVESRRVRRWERGEDLGLAREADPGRFTRAVRHLEGDRLTGGVARRPDRGGAAGADEIAEREAGQERRRAHRRCRTAWSDAAVERAGRAAPQAAMTVGTARHRAIITPTRGPVLRGSPSMRAAAGWMRFAPGARGGQRAAGLPAARSLSAA
jgi:hypothetical protein